jgi:hypothetical protein
MRRSSNYLAVLAAGIVATVLAPIAHSSPVAASAPGIGRTLVVQGFAVTPRWVKRAREAGAADYVASKGHLFLLVDIRIVRKGGHDAYYLDPQDFHLLTSSGGIIDSEQFGMRGEMQTRHLYSKPAEGVVGFDVPSGERRLTLLWQPLLNSNPDAQAMWSISASGAIVQYYQ